MSRVPLPQPEIALVGAFGVLAFVPLVVLKMSSEIAQDDKVALNSKFLLEMRRFTGEGPLISSLRITFLGNTQTLVVVTAIACGALLIMGQLDRSATLLIGIGPGIGIVSLFRKWIGRATPDVIPPLAIYGTASYPSAHVTNSAMVYFAIARLIAQLSATIRKRAAILAAAITLVVAIARSRLFLGVHLPADVLAGWVFGAAWVLLCWSFGSWFCERRRKKS